jgi:geranylgeranyl pyrophosphate synthase
LDFFSEYKKITDLLDYDLKKLDEYFDIRFWDTGNQKIAPILKEFFSNRGKQIRPVLIFLITRAMGVEPSDFHYKLAFSTELVHNATLIHDDIIDCSLIRRGRNTLNFDYDSKLAVLTGDYLLSFVLGLLADVESEEIRKIYSKAVFNIVNGELEQYFCRFKIITIDEYIEKSKNKTAGLFEAGIVSAFIYNEKSHDYFENVRNFALNFGTAFQIVNDIQNFEDSDKAFEDITNGNYTAPLIYYVQDNCVKNINNEKKLIQHVKTSGSIEKTGCLADSYINLAIENINFLEDNQYKDAIKNLCNLFKSRIDG